MTTIAKIKIKCPCCKKKFKATTIVSTNFLGGETTDFHVLSLGAQPIFIQIYTCSFCGFSGYRNEFENSIDNNLKKNISEKLTPVIRNGENSPEKKYEYAALIAKWSNKQAIEIANRYLKASWCAKYLKLQEKEFFYRRQAIKYYEEALSKNEIEKTQVAKITYLVGELYRRIGNKDKANLWFERVPQVAGEDKEKQWIVNLAKQQKENPKEFIEVGE